MDIKKVTFNYTGALQTWTPPKGVIRIKIECWGARGGGSMRSGSANNDGAYGGYCYGEYILTDDLPRQLQIYVGGVGSNGRYSTAPGGWNGGGYGTYDGRDDEGGGGGGGATDVRLIPASTGSWYDTSHTSWETDKSLLSRIIVAGGGGGLSWTFTPGVGGGLIGGTGANAISLPATQADGYALGKGQDAYGTGYDGGGGNDGVGGGGGGWYGGRTLDLPGICSGCGGSSYYGILLNAGTTAGVNDGNGKVVITYYDEYFFLENNGKYYIPNKYNFDPNSNSFYPVTLFDIGDYVKNGLVSRLIELNSPFTINGTKYIPSDILDFKQSRICIFNTNYLYKINIQYVPSNIALSKTNIKIKDKYNPISEELETTFLNITATDKSKIDFFLDYGQAKSYKSCSILNTEIINNDFYLNFKLNNQNSLLKSVTLFGKDNKVFSKLKDYSIDVYYDPNNKYIKFKNSYDKLIINKLGQEDLIYINDTLDKF